MKTFIYISFLFLSVTAKSQINSDLPIRKELTEIILNYRDNGVKKFKIEYKESWERTQGWHEHIYYSFENDTALAFSEDEQDDWKCVIRNNVITDIPHPETITATDSLRRINPFKIVDSANVKIMYVYSLKGTDSTLTYRSAFTYDSLGREILFISWGLQGQEHRNKTETAYLPGGSIQKTYYKFAGKGWYGEQIWHVTGREITQTIVEITPSKKIETTYYTNINNDPAFAEVVMEDTQEEITTISYYNKHHLLTKMKKTTITKTDKGNEKSKEWFRPAILK